MQHLLRHHPQQPPTRVGKVVSTATDGTPHSGADSRFSHRVISLGGVSAARCSECTWGDRDGGGGGGSERVGGKEWVGVGWGVGKEGNRKEGDFVTLWWSFWLWTRSSWMSFPLLFDAAVWPSVWPCSLVRAWSGMILLFNRRSHDNQPPWASRDKPILCLHIQCVDSRTGVSSSRRLLPSSPPKVQSVPQWWPAWLCRTISQCLVVPVYARCDLGSEEFLLGQQPSFSPLPLRRTFALVVCWLVELVPLLLGGKWCMGSGLGGQLVGDPTLGFG